MRARRRMVAGAGGALLLFIALVAGSPAQDTTPGFAAAALADGTPGRIGVIGIDAYDRESYSGGAEGRGLETSGGDARVSIVKQDGRPYATATAGVRGVKIFGRLVTAYGVRRSAQAFPGTVTYGGSVEGLVIAGRAIGDVREARTYDLDGYGSAKVLTGEAGLEVTLTRDYGDYPAGSRVVVARVGAEAHAIETAPRSRPRPERERQALDTLLGDARKQRAARRRRREARLVRREAPKIEPKLTGQRYAFPVFGRNASAADDWGGPRATGAHEGNDVFAPFGAPVVAVADGVVEKVGTKRISGNRLWLRTRGGDEFFYAHMSAFSPEARNGNRVRAGTVLGFVGSTGDAEPTPPHLHFEIHPGGGDAVDPHPFLLAWQSRRDVAPSAWLLRNGANTEERPGTLVEVRDFIATR